MVKTFEQFISDKKEERIDEGFLDTVKKAISAVVSVVSPQEQKASPFPTQT